MDTSEKTIKKSERDYHAKLVVHGMPTLTRKDAQRMAYWLRQQADIVECERDAYAKTYIARFMK